MNSNTLLEINSLHSGAHNSNEGEYTFIAHSRLIFLKSFTSFNIHAGIIFGFSEKTVEKHIALGIRRTTEYLFERSYFAPAKGKPADVHPITEASRGGRS